MQPYQNIFDLSVIVDHDHNFSKTRSLSPKITDIVSDNHMIETLRQTNGKDFKIYVAQK